MTIKQQGGVFGRNPTFNDVDANSVTADQATVNGVLLADEVGINTSPSYPLHVVRDTAGFIAGFRNSDATTRARTIVAGNSFGDLVTEVAANTGHSVIYSDSGKTLALGANASTTAALTVNTNQTVSFRENLIIANGKGIDFSATAGTGTSEVLSDYEEGTWAMVLTSASGSFTSITYDPNASSFYTKIGRLVTIQGYFMTDAITAGTAAGDIYISLPFTVANLTGSGDGGTGAIGYASSWGGDVPFSVAPRGGDNKMNIHYRTSANGNVSNMQVGDLATGANSNVMTFTAMYIAA
jgi:hypothetical protein